MEAKKYIENYLKNREKTVKKKTKQPQEAVRFTICSPGDSEGDEKTVWG